MGMAHDYLAVGHSHLLDCETEIPAAKDFDCHSAVGHQGQGGRWRCVTVRRTGHCTGGNDRHWQHHRCGHGGRHGWARSGALVLAHWRLWHCHQVWRGTAGHQISCQDARRNHAGRTHVRAGARTQAQVAGSLVCSVHYLRIIGHWGIGAGQCHQHHLL